jgi:hypothetical protein
LGRIAVGPHCRRVGVADLVAFAPEEQFTVDAAALLHRNPMSANDGREPHGVVRCTWLRGGETGTAVLPRRARETRRSHADGTILSMAIIPGDNRYGTAGKRVVRSYRDTARQEIRDLNVSTRLRGPLAAAHLDGDRSNVLPADTRKNTALTVAKSHGVDAGIEPYGLIQATVLRDDAAPAPSARRTSAGLA